MNKGQEEELEDRKGNGRALRRFRTLAGLTMGDLADLGGCPVSCISAIERGETVMGFPMMICMLMGLVNEEWEKRNPPVLIDADSGRKTIIDSVGDPADYRKALDEDHE